MDPPTTKLRNQTESQLSGQWKMKANPSDHKRSSGLARLWYPYFVIAMVQYSSTSNNEINMRLLIRLKEEISKERPQMKKKYSFTKTIHRVTVIRNDSKTAWTLLGIASVSIGFSKFRPERLLLVREPQRNAIYGSDEGVTNWTIFWRVGYVVI